MKNKVMFVLLTALLIVGVSVSTVKATVLKTKVKEQEKELFEAGRSYPEIYDVINSVTYEGFKEKIANSENFYVYVGRPSCGDCSEFEPKFIQLLKEFNIEKEIVYLNVHGLKKNNQEWENFKESTSILYTPTIAKFENGKLADKFEWTPEKGISINKVHTWLEKNFNQKEMIQNE